MHGGMKNRFPAELNQRTSSQIVPVFGRRSAQLQSMAMATSIDLQMDPRNRVFVVTDSAHKLSDFLAYVENNYALTLAYSRQEVLADTDLRSAAAVVFTDQPNDMDARRFCERIDPRWKERPKVIAAGPRNSPWLTFVKGQTAVDGVIHTNAPSEQQIRTFGVLVSLRAEQALAELGPKAMTIWRESSKVLKNIEGLVEAGQPIPRAAVHNLAESVVEGTEDALLCDMMRVLREHHAETLVHSLDVAMNVLLLGRHVGVRSKADQRLLFEAGIMHDVGKMEIPSGILRKPGKLTAEEFAVMRQHPVSAVRILQESGGYDEHVIWAAAHHHEKIDGSGYPYGLAGAKISEIGRLTAVCDVFCALTERRSYKPPTPPEKAFDIMKSMGPGQLDPTLLERMMEMVYGSLPTQKLAV